MPETLSIITRVDELDSDIMLVEKLPLRYLRRSIPAGHASLTKDRS
jgi:hypothetical protein